MSERRKNRSKNKTVAYIAAGVIHAALIGALLVNFTSKSTSVEADYAEKVDTIKATTISESEIRKQQDILKRNDKQKEREKAHEKKRLEELKRQSEQEKQQIEDLKLKQQEELDKTADLELQRKAIALKKLKEEEERKKELEKQKKRDALAKKKRDAKVKKEKERLRKLEQQRIAREKQEYEAQQEMNRILQEEQEMMDARRAAERRTTLQGKYAALIKQKVRSKISMPPGVRQNITTRVNVRLTSEGNVRSVRVTSSSGDAVFDKAVETAIYAATPLPIPTIEEDSLLHGKFQDLNLKYSPADF